MRHASRKLAAAAFRNTSFEISRARVKSDEIYSPTYRQVTILLEESVIDGVNRTYHFYRETLRERQKDMRRWRKYPDGFLTILP